MSGARTPLKVKLALSHRTPTGMVSALGPAKALARWPNSIQHGSAKPAEITRKSRAPQRRPLTDVFSSHLVCSGHRLDRRSGDVAGVEPDPALRQPGHPEIARSLFVQGNDDDRPSCPCL